MDEIRRAGLPDINALAALGQLAGFNRWSEKQFVEAIGHDIVWLVEDKGGLIAFAIFSLVIDEAELHNVVVLPARQGRGIGFSLLSHALQQLKNSGARKCLLEVGVSNIHAITLYKKLGFALLATRKNYYARPQGREDALVMQLELAEEKT